MSLLYFSLLLVLIYTKKYSFSFEGGNFKYGYYPPTDEIGTYTSSQWPGKRRKHTFFNLPEGFGISSGIGFGHCSYIEMRDKDDFFMYHYCSENNDGPMDRRSTERRSAGVIVSPPNGELNDVWFYNTSLAMWAFLSGENVTCYLVTGSPVMNGQFQFSKKNRIAKRSSAVSASTEKYVYIFGGSTHYPYYYDHIFRNDLWVIDITSKELSLFYGDHTKDRNFHFGNYTHRKEFSEYTHPNGVREAIGLTYNNNLIVFGGYGMFDLKSRSSNDLFEYSMDLKKWKWRSGGGDVNIYGNYVTKGEYDKDNLIPARHNAMGWIVNDEMYVYGGLAILVGDVPIPVLNIYNTLWKYNLVDDEWALLYGDFGEFNKKGVYNGQKGVFDSENKINCRFLSATAVSDDQKYLYLAQGMGKSNDNSMRYFADIWAFDIKSENWALIHVSGDEDGYFEKENSVHTEKYIFHQNNELGAKYGTNVALINGEFYVYGGSVIDVSGKDYAEVSNVLYKGRLVEKCFSKDEDDDGVCSGNGVCITDNVCHCYENYYGRKCEITKCWNVFSNESAVCSKNGKCTESNKCECILLYEGQQCYENIIIKYWYVSIPAMFGVVLIVAALIFIIFFFTFRFNSYQNRLKKFSKIKDIDVILNEQNSSSQINLSNLRIRKELFVIKSEDLELISVLGQGGSGSKLYLSILILL